MFHPNWSQNCPSHGGVGVTIWSPMVTMVPRYQLDGGLVHGLQLHFESPGLCRLRQVLRGTLGGFELAAPPGSSDPRCQEHVHTWQCVKTNSNIKIAGKWMFIPLKMVLIGIDPYPHLPCMCVDWKLLYLLPKACATT